MDDHTPLMHVRLDPIQPAQSILELYGYLESLTGPAHVEPHEVVLGPARGGIARKRVGHPGCAAGSRGQPALDALHTKITYSERCLLSSQPHMLSRSFHRGPKLGQIAGHRMFSCTMSSQRTAKYLMLPHCLSASND